MLRRVWGVPHSGPTSVNTLLLSPSQLPHLSEPAVFDGDPERHEVSVGLCGSLVNIPNNPVSGEGRAAFPLYTDEDTKPQRGCLPFPKSHSW